MQHFPCPFSASQGIDVQQSLFGGKPNEGSQLLTPQRRPVSQPYNLKGSYNQKGTNL